MSSCLAELFLQAEPVDLGAFLLALTSPAHPKPQRPQVVGHPRAKKNMTNHCYCLNNLIERGHGPVEPILPQAYGSGQATGIFNAFLDFDDAGVAARLTREELNFGGFGFLGGSPLASSSPRNPTPTPASDQTRQRPSGASGEDEGPPLEPDFEAFNASMSRGGRFRQFRFGRRRKASTAAGWFEGEV